MLDHLDSKPGTILGPRFQRCVPDPGFPAGRRASPAHPDTRHRTDQPVTPPQPATYGGKRPSESVIHMAGPGASGAVAAGRVAPGPGSGAAMATSQSRGRQSLDAVVGVASDLSLPDVLLRIVRSSRLGPCTWIRTGGRRALVAVRRATRSAAFHPRKVRQWLSRSSCSVSFTGPRRPSTPRAGNTAARHRAHDRAGKRFSILALPNRSYRTVSATCSLVLREFPHQ